MLVVILLFTLLALIIVFGVTAFNMNVRRRNHSKKLEKIQKQLDKIESRKAADAANPKPDRE